MNYLKICTIIFWLIHTFLYLTRALHGLRTSTGTKPVEERNRKTPNVVLLNKGDIQWHYDASVWDADRRDAEERWAVGGHCAALALQFDESFLTFWHYCIHKSQMDFFPLFCCSFTFAFFFFFFFFFLQKSVSIANRPEQLDRRFSRFWPVFNWFSGSSSGSLLVRL